MRRPSTPRSRQPAGGRWIICTGLLITCGHGHRAPAGPQFRYVPYKGNGPALTDLVAGNTGFMYSGSFNSALPFIQNGQVKALAVTSGKVEALPSRSPRWAASRTAGLRCRHLANPGRAQRHAGAYPEETDTALQAALKDPEVMKSSGFQGAEPMDKDPTAGAYVASEYERWSSTIKRLEA